MITEIILADDDGKIEITQQANELTIAQFVLLGQDEIAEIIRMTRDLEFEIEY